jgi:hypothetical protein
MKIRTKIQVTARAVMMTIVGGALVASAATARAADPDTQPPPVVAPTVVDPPPAVVPAPVEPPSGPLAPHTGDPAVDPGDPAAVGTPTEVTPVVPEPVNPAAPTTPAYVEPEATTMQRRRWVPQLGGALLVGGGYEDFTDSNLRAMTGAGGAWDARLVGGTRQFIGIEAAYVGAARSINTLGVTNSNLVSNGVEGALRLNIPVAQGMSLIEPFGLIGLGWQHYNITNTPAATADVAKTDDVLTMPVGGGLEAAYGQFMLDARYTYRFTYLNDLMRATGGRLNNWGISGNLGVAF